MVKLSKQPIFKTEFPNTNFVLGEVPANPSVAPTEALHNRLLLSLSDDCNSVITLQTTHPYIKTPDLNIVTRNPYCRLRKIEPPTQLPTPTSANIDQSCATSGLTLQYDAYLLLSESGRESRVDSTNANCMYFEECRISVYSWKYTGLPLGVYEGMTYYFLARWTASINYKVNSASIQSSTLPRDEIEFTEIADNYRRDGYNIPDDYLTNPRAIWTASGTVDCTTYIDVSYRQTTVFDNPTLAQFIRGGVGIIGMDSQRFDELQSKIYTPLIRTGRTFAYSYNQSISDLTIDSVFGNSSLVLENEYIDDFYGIKVYQYRGTQTTVEFQTTAYLCAPFDNPRPTPTQTPPPPPKMNCCPNVRENDALLRLILKRIGDPLTVNIRDYDETTKGYQPYDEQQVTLFNAVRINTNRAEVINDIIGISEYPITAPKSIIEDYRLQLPEEIDDLWGIYDDEAQSIQLASLTQFLRWQVDQESAVMGGWHQIIKYEKDGKTETVRLVNIAETLKELIIIQAGQNKDNSLIVDLLLRVLTDLISVKSNVIRSNYIIEDIQDYLDYPTKEKKVDFPISITTPEKGLSFVENETIKRVLKPSVVSTTYQDWTGKNSLHDKLLDLLQGAAAIRGAFTESGEELINLVKSGDGKSPTPFEDWANSLGNNSD